MGNGIHMGTKGGGTDMRFTVDGYVEMLDALRESGYGIADYSCWDEYEKCAILRHDVDFDMYQALSMAKVECKQGVKSTYFVLLTSDFYNIHSAANRRLLNEIRGMGHTIGLHFDETAYPEDAGNVEKVVQDIKKELLTLSDVLGGPVGQLILTGSFSSAGSNTCRTQGCTGGSLPGI